MGNRPYTWTGEETHEYDNIINLPHPISSRHPPMSISNRAAQFAPFAALVGYDAEIDEAARLTEDRTNVFDDELEQLNEKLFQLSEECSTVQASQKRDSPLPFPCVRVSYYLPDTKKAGGANLSYSGPLKRVDNVQMILLFKDGKTIPLADVIDIIKEGDMP